MRTTALFLTVLGCTLAVPNGYYHQEYNYKTSASAYKNNELQHKTDDQGYYRKDGDLEGRVRPRVDSNSEHSEYVNPNIRNGDYRTGMIGAANGDLSSYGHLRADLGAYGAHDLSEGMAHSDHIAGRRGAYSDFNSGSSYGANSYGSSQSYSTSSNLRSVTSRLQQELERDLQEALQEQRAYSHSSQTRTAELERELRQNLTNRLNAELTRQYGQQSVRGGLSYSLAGGRLQSTANYDNRELEDLKRGLENTLLSQLRTQSTHTHNSQINTYDTHHNSYGYQTTTLRPYYTTPYYAAITTTRPYYTGQYIQPVDTYPVSNRESITTIASRVQNQLDSRLNQLLEDTQRTYFSTGSSFSHTHTEGVLERLKNELRNNITLLLNDEVSRTYGTQIPKDGHMYTVGSSGATLGQYNYAIRDLESLRSQIERNLIDKLSRDFETYRSRWSQHSQQQQTNIYHSGGNIQYSTPRYDVYSTPHYNNRYDTYSTPRYNSYNSDVEHLSTRPTSSHLGPLISSGGGHYNQESGTYGISGSSSSGASSISQLQRQLQQDLSRQLQSAITRGHYGSYSTSGSYNPQSYQVSLQQLTDELNRNLTRQLQEYSASGYYSTHGNVDQAQLNNLRSQLQADLTRQLQQGLQQSYSSSSSYSASSSSSSDGNYRPVRGFDNYQLGQYKMGVATAQGEDCLGDDPAAYNSHRMKRSYPPYRSQPIGLAYSGGYGHNRDNYGYGGNFRERQQPVQGQQVEELGQQVDDLDLTQQVEDSDFDSVQLGSQNQQQLEAGQLVDDSDLTQQVEDSDFGIQLGSHNQHQTELGQQVDHSDLTQQVEDSGFERVQLGQQIDDSDLTQQVEDVQKLESGSLYQKQDELGQQVDDSDLTQQVEDSDFGRAPTGSHGRHPSGLHIQHQIGVGQQIDDSDLTQQVEDSEFERVQLGTPTHKVTPVDNSDLTQQVEDSGIRDLHLGSPQNQQEIEGQVEDNSDLTQNIRPIFGHAPRRHQFYHEQDLTQKVEENTDGKLQFGSAGQQQITNDDQLTGNQLSHITGKLEEDLAKQLQKAVHSHRYEITYSSSGYPSQISFDRSYEQLLKELERNLTKELEHISSTAGRYGSSYSFTISSNNPQLAKLREKIQSDLQKQLSKELSATYGYSNSWSSSSSSSSINKQVGPNQIDSTRLTYGNNLNDLETDHFKDFTQRQVQLAQHLKDELSQQLKTAIQTTYTEINSGLGNVDSQALYQKLVNEIERNLAEKTNSYFYLQTYNTQELNILRKKLLEDLTLQLQKEVSKIRNNRPETNLGQQQIGQEIESPELNQQVQETPFELGQQQIGQHQLGADLTQQSEDNTEDLTQQIEDKTPGKLQFGNQQIDSTRLTNGNSLGDFETNNFKDFNERQVQTALQLKDELSRQLKNAIQTTYYTELNSGQGNVESQVLYQKLIKEIERNLKRKTSSYSYLYTFNTQELNTLRKQLLEDLTLQLQKEVSKIRNNRPETNLGQQQIGQEVESSELNQQVQETPFGISEQGQHQLGADLTQQTEDNTEDLTQQIEDKSPGKLQFGNQQFEQDSVDSQDTQQLVDSGVGISQFEGQQEDLQPVPQNQVGQFQVTGGSGGIPKRPLENHYLTQNQLDLNHQVDDSYYKPQQIPSASLYGSRPVTRRPVNNFLDREREETLNSNQYVHGQPQKPSSLPTLNQVVQQQQFGTSDFEENNTELPSLVEPLRVPEDDDLTQQQVQQQPFGPSDFEELPSPVESLRVPETDDLTQQQVDLSQQSIDSDVLYGPSNIDKTLNPGQALPIEQTSQQLHPLTGNQDGQVPLGPTGGQSVGVTSQGQIITQPQTLTDAEKQSLLLIEALRAHQQNRGQTSTGQSLTDTYTTRPLTYSQAVQHGSYGHTGDQSFSGSQIVEPTEPLVSYNQRQEAFKVYLNQQQIQFAKQLENELSKQLQEAITEDYKVYTDSSTAHLSPNPQLYQIRYHQFSEKLQKNITEKLEEILGPAQYGSPSFSVYVTLTDKQREQLVNQLQADLLQQLHNSLQISYGLQQDNGRNFGYTRQHSSTSIVSNSYGSGSGYSHHHHYHFNSPNSGFGNPPVGQVHYGQQAGETFETASEFQPIELQHADVVHNVEPQSNYNTGVKGHGRHYHHHHHQYNTFQSPPSAVGDDFQQPIAGTPLLPSAAIQVQPEGVVAPLPAEPAPPSPVEPEHPLQVDAIPTAPAVNQEDLPWWKRFGNKVKQGAHSLKEKIVG